MAVPARRTSKMRKNTRRSHHALSAQNTNTCNNCGAVTLSHRACMKCKTYKGVSIYGTDDNKANQSKNDEQKATDKKTKKVAGSQPKEKNKK